MFRRVSALCGEMVHAQSTLTLMIMSVSVRNDLKSGFCLLLSFAFYLFLSFAVKFTVYCCHQLGKNYVL